MSWRDLKKWTLAAAAIAVAMAAHAQIKLPTVQVPKLPVQLPDLDKTLNGATGALDPTRLVDLRRLRVRTLLRENRAVLEADPRGAPMVRAEVTAFSPTAQALERALAAGFTVARERALPGLDARIVVLRAPERLSTRAALKKLRRLDAQGVYDFNHVYLEGGEVGPAAEVTSLAAPLRVSQASSQPSSQAGAKKVGLIDAGVAAGHPLLAAQVIHRHGCAGETKISAHGTAVASLLIGQGDTFRGAAPGAELYAADVYCGAPTGGAVDAIAEAFGWLSQERVAVMNVSLVGPPNALLESVVGLVIARGHIVVAAVGNDGPSAPPLYPAAYPGVVGVTGVDGKHRVLLEALRGKQVDFAALGADLSAANQTAAVVAVRGTSFAAPTVAGMLAMDLDAPEAGAAERAVARLAARALDLGARGPDPVYGQGFVAPGPAVASLSR